MQISVTEAQAQLIDLVRRAEAGDEIVLTCHGQPAVRLVPVQGVAMDASRRWQIVEAASRAGAAQALPGLDAARSQDFLYDENGLPE